jgi:hypothetical protein
VEVDFPFYRHYDETPDFGHPDHYYQRVESNGTVFSIHRTDDEGYGRTEDDGRALTFELSIEREHFSGSSADYMLGRGMYSSSAAKFYEMLERARKFIDRFPPR